MGVRETANYGLFRDPPSCGRKCQAWGDPRSDASGELYHLDHTVKGRSACYLECGFERTTMKGQPGIQARDDRAGTTGAKMKTERNGKVQGTSWRWSGLACEMERKTG